FCRPDPFPPGSVLLAANRGTSRNRREEPSPKMHVLSVAARDRDLCMRSNTQRGTFWSLQIWPKEGSIFATPHGAATNSMYAVANFRPKDLLAGVLFFLEIPPRRLARSI